VQKHFEQGSVLIVAPDEADVDLLGEAIISTGLTPLKITAAMARDERYSNYLLAMNQSKSIVIGTRSSVFVPVKGLASIIVFKESSLDHYEVRSPGWNTRDVAFLRAQLEKVNLVFTGFSPSIEVSLKIENRELEYSNTRENVPVKAFTPSDGSLLPGRIFSEIRSALKEGPVLFIAPRKGYGNAVLCAHCRNIAQCSCGGRLTVASRGANPTCVHCGSIFQQWKCTFCQRDKQYLAARGIDRAAEELSRAFPGYPVILSAGDVIKRRIDNKPALVLATPGSQPQVAQGYSAVVILDGTRFFAHTDLRTAERARELFLESSSLISKKGSVLLVIDDSHPIIASIARWNIAPMLKRELAEREELALPPYSTSAVLVMDQLSASQIHSGLKKAIDQGRLPDSTRIFVPAIIAKGQAKIVLHVANAQAQLMISTLHELQRKRSIAKKDLFTVRINPYSL
jgi:primosomal protein N' (replication factor Y)